ncbi:MAG: group II intron maturase-specific domain-containing protein, partial [Halomonas sp.]
QVVAYLRRYLLGWQGYFKLSQTPRLWRSLDGWIRRRLRALHLKQWRRGKPIYRELLRLGATPRVAQSVAAVSRRWWHNRLSGVPHVLTVAYIARLGVPRLSSPQRLEPPGADPHAGWCGRGSVSHADRPYADKRIRGSRR